MGEDNGHPSDDRDTEAQRPDDGASEADRALSERERQVEAREGEMDDREALSAQPSGQADARDDRADLHQTDRVVEEAEVNEILSDAQVRDARADARDAAANRRDDAAALDALVYGTNAARPFKGRHVAAKDRQASRDDRTSAHLDRYLLAGTEPSERPIDDRDPDVEAE